MGSGRSKEAKPRETARVSAQEQPGIGGVANVNNQKRNNHQRDNHNDSDFFQTNGRKGNQDQGKEPTHRTFITQQDIETHSYETERGSKGHKRSMEETIGETDEIENFVSTNTWSYPTTVDTSDFPETYAQRKQREQYTLNQQKLLRQKTVVRDPKVWKDDNETVAVPSLVAVSSSGFDPDKFRSVNKAQPTKRTLFTTEPPGDVSDQFVHSQSFMDDFEVTPQHKEMPKQLPSYNESELNLMASLEQELL